jgi:hypothetical protein
MIVYWMAFWKFCLIASLLVFAGMSVWVTIGGFADIKRLFKRLGESDENDQ